MAIDQQGAWDIIDASRTRVDPDTASKQIIKLCETYKPNEWLIDDDNASKVFMPLVATAARETHTYVPWHPMPMRGQDKETRAAALRGQFKRRRVFMPKDAHWTKWLLTEILGFPNLVGQGVDDGVDALSCLGRRLASTEKQAPDPVKAPPPKTMQAMTLNELFEDRGHRRGSRLRIYGHTMSSQYDSASTQSDGTIQSLRKLEETPQGKRDRWQQEIASAEKELKKFHDQARRVNKRYIDDRDAVETNQKWFNIFNTNVGIMEASLYANIPTADVSRKFVDMNDDVARVAGMILQRCIQQDMSEPECDFDQVMRQCVSDYKDHYKASYF